MHWTYLFNYLQNKARKHNNAYSLWRQSAEKEHCISQLAFVLAEE